MSTVQDDSQRESAAMLPPRPADAHKGRTGRVAIIAGSRTMSGAAGLCALGALRGGAGLVRVLTSASAQPIVAAAEMCVMSVPLAEDAQGRISLAAAETMIDELEWADVVAIGPGLGRSAELTALLARLLESVSKPMVLDADGLSALADMKQWWPQCSAPTVLTPHAGEMARLRRGAGLADADAGDASARATIAAEMAGLTGAVVLLKGHETVVCHADSLYVNQTGNAGMATGGMGDVLTGLIAALIGQGLSPFDAACLAAHCHGSAADALARSVGPVGYLAREVADAIPAELAKRIGPATKQ